MQIGVIGAGCCSPSVGRIAEEVGREIAKATATLICGGLEGVMNAAARGAKLEGGLTVGILPGVNPGDANPYIDVSIVTGLGHARNVLVVHSSDALIAVTGGYGTLSEIAIALKLKKPVVGLNTWDVTEEIVQAKNPREAVSLAISLFSSTSPLSPS